MSLALYRKYRPSTFADVIGQEHVTTPLSNALTSGQIHHAYLFSGPRGCGKTSSARIMARSLNCEKGPTPEPCRMWAGAIAQSRIKRLVFGSFDEKYGAVGSVWDLLWDTRAFYKSEVLSGVLDKECSQLLSEFFKINVKQ